VSKLVLFFPSVPHVYSFLPLFRTSHPHSFTVFPSSVFSSLAPCYLLSFFSFLLCISVFYMLMLTRSQNYVLPAKNDEPSTEPGMAKKQPPRNVFVAPGHPNNFSSAI